MIRVIAYIYMCICVGWFMDWAWKKSDRYFWKGVGFGLLIITLYALFILSVLIVTGHSITWR